jgi:hypothetical protein
MTSCRWCGRSRCRASHGGRMRVRATRRTSTANFKNGDDEPLATPATLPAVSERGDIEPGTPSRTWWADMRTKSRTHIQGATV